MRPNLTGKGFECASAKNERQYQQTYAIDGIGKRFLASSLILLCHFGYFGFGKIEMKLNNAYAPFIAYCEARGKHTTILEFSSKTLKLPQNSHLGIILRKKFVNTPQIPIVS